MGCMPSKRVEAAAATDAYRPAPTSIALFDVAAIEEPWLAYAAAHPPSPSKPNVLEKLDDFDHSDSAPRSWTDVSKALERLKPDLLQPVLAPVPPCLKNNPSFHTLEELDARLSRKEIPEPTGVVVQAARGKSRSPPITPGDNNAEGIRPLKDNIFIIRDRMEREEKTNGGGWRRSDLLSGFPEKCPPGGAGAVVLYTTTLRGVRRTFDDCEKVRVALEDQQVAVDERDVALHGGYLAELKELLGEGTPVPRLFVKGRYVGGVEKVVELSESGKLADLLRAAGARKGSGRRGCEGCGGARFVPCLTCRGSRKVAGGGGKGGVARCSSCNENGLVHCPLCHSDDR